MYFLSLFTILKSAGDRLERMKFLMGDLRRRSLDIPWWLGIRFPQSLRWGLGIRRFVNLNKALLGMWLWRFGHEVSHLWQQMIISKYGEDGGVGV